MQTPTYHLTNQNATPDTIKLYDFLCSLKGTGILSGQQECPRDMTHGDELAYIQKVSGHLPALLGLDYIDNDYNGTNNRAINWHNKGGIVSICWHWGIPPHGLGYHSSQQSVDLEELLTPGTPLHQGFMENMDLTASALAKLRDAGIPILWRPLHEFDGEWFWWGKGGPEAFQSLWRIMYDRFTNYHHLDNLIWVLGYSHVMKDGWYPGDAFVDCIGADAYSEGIHEELYNWILTQTTKAMPVCHHENGPIPEPGLLAAKKIDWCWFLTWHTMHIHEQNSADYINYVYNHPYVITLEKLREIYKR